MDIIQYFLEQVLHPIFAVNLVFGVQSALFSVNFQAAAHDLGQLENTESGNGIRERKQKRTVRAHAHDLNEWAGQPINGRIETCSIKFVWFHVHCISERD